MVAANAEIMLESEIIFEIFRIMRNVRRGRKKVNGLYPANTKSPNRKPYIVATALPPLTRPTRRACSNPEKANDRGTPGHLCFA